MPRYRFHVDADSDVTLKLEVVRDGNPKTCSKPVTEDNGYDDIYRAKYDKMFMVIVHDSLGRVNFGIRVKALAGGNTHVEKRNLTLSGYDEGFIDARFPNGGLSVEAGTLD
jgi:hypothetical protein